MDAAFRKGDYYLLLPKIDLILNAQCAQALEGKNLQDMLTSFSAGGGAAAPAAAAPAAGGAAAAADAPEEKKEEEKEEESDDDMGFGLFD